jgi:serine/threonine-protein kinase
VGDDKKTQLGTTPGRTHRPTGSQTPASAATTAVPAPPVGTPAPGSAPKTSYIPEVKDPLLGATIAGRYQIARKLGEGGMGAVYLATHMVLEKQVALKILHGEFARKPDLVDRFMQEAKSASRIRHENVIDISDFGSTPEGLVFFAMELLHGHDLHEEVSRARLSGQLLPWARSKKIFLQICGALGAAHAKGIVHRDLKPENVYLIDFLGDPDFVKLLDFGIAKLTDVSTEEGGRKLTKTGMLFGTPEYMSPEQARGEHVDHRVDVYAMGCILFQLVSGRVPFEAENFMGVLSMHLTEEPPQIAPETFDRIGAPRALAGVIDKALEKDRNVRWQTIEELANAVREVSGDPLPADRSQPMRVAAGAGPTTRARPPTGPVGSAEAPALLTAAARPRTREPTGRQKTQWTGNLHVPEVAEAPQKQASRSKLPLVIGAVLVVGGGGAAAFFATRGGGGSSNAAGSAAGSGSATVASGGSGSQVVVPPPKPQEPPPAPVPESVKITFDSTPHGATVTDLTIGKPIGKTPLKYKVAGSHTPRQFAFHKDGYGDTTVELVPDHEPIDYNEKLEKGAAAGAVHVVPVPDATIKAGGVGEVKTGSGTATAVTHPETAVTHPDTGSAKAPEGSAATKPPEKTPEKPPAGSAKPDDETGPVQLKTPFPSGSGT